MTALDIRTRLSNPLASYVRFRGDMSRMRPVLFLKLFWTTFHRLLWSANTGGSFWMRRPWQALFIFVHWNLFATIVTWQCSCRSTTSQVSQIHMPARSMVLVFRTRLVLWFLCFELGWFSWGYHLYSFLILCSQIIMSRSRVPNLSELSCFVGK